MNDPIADLLTRLRNSSKAKLRFIDVEWSKMKESITKVLKKTGFISHYLIKEEKKKTVMRIFLKYGLENEPVLNQLERISKSSCRKYVSYKDVPTVRGGIGIAILSTPRGVLEGAQAIEEKVGGELLCLVY